MRVFLLTILLLLSTRLLQGQVQAGTSVVNMFKGTMNRADIGMGKPTILEFFGEHCIVCFKMLPKLDTLFGDFRDSVSFVLLGEDNEQLPRTFELYKRKYRISLDLMCNPKLYSKFKPPYQPYFAWIDEKGVIIGYSGPFLVSEKNIRLFLNKEYDFLADSNAGKLISIDNREIFMEKDVIVQTSFFKTKDSILYSSPIVLKVEHSNPQVRYVNVRLRELCFIAWFGRQAWMRGEPEYEETWPKVLIDGDEEFEVMMNKKISYSMRFDSFRPTTYLQEFLINDIERTFNIKGSLEFREMPCWIVTTDDSSRYFMRSKADESKALMKETYGGIYVRATPFPEVLRVIESKTKPNLPLIDESGVRWPIDINISAIMTDWDDVVSALRKIGINVKQGRRIMRVLVIRQTVK